MLSNLRTRTIDLTDEHAIFTGSPDATGQLTAKDSDDRSGGRVFKSNLSMPPSCDFFYFEVELVSIPTGA